MRQSHTVINNQEGSMIFIVTLVLALMTIIGISASTMSVTESFIVRNVGIFKENLHMVDGALVELLQTAIDMDLPIPGNDPNDLDPALTSLDWVNDKDLWETSGKEAEWYNTAFTGHVLIADPTDPNVNAMVPDALATINIPVRRGEWDGVTDADSPLRCAMVGWDGAPGSSLKATQPSRKIALLLAEYVSRENFGTLRLEAGIEKLF